MAYQTHVISAITDIPAKVHAFATSIGMTVTGTTAAPIVARPGGSTIGFKLEATVSGYDHSLTWTGQDAVVTSKAKIVSPKMYGTTAVPLVSLPSKLHLFGKSSPKAFLAIVIEYGDNLFRHLYFGTMEIAGSYTGGEVVSGASFKSSPNGYDYPMSFRPSHNYLFSARGRLFPIAESGGLRAVHASNPVSWRRFFGSENYLPSVDMGNGAALGGFSDDVNDGYVARGRSPFAGVTVLAPINLLASMPLTGDSYYVPLGRPAGIRMVNMQDIDPGAQIALGTDNWRAFPVFSKSASQTVQQASGGWGAGETSYFVGYAYPEA